MKSIFRKVHFTRHVPNWSIVEFVVEDSGGECAQLCLVLILRALSMQAPRPGRGPAQINDGLWSTEKRTNMTLIGCTEHSDGVEKRAHSHSSNRIISHKQRAGTQQRERDFAEKRQHHIKWPQTDNLSHSYKHMNFMCIRYKISNKWHM